MAVYTDELRWHRLDPLSRNWQRLPPMPMLPCKEESKRNFGFQMWNPMASGIDVIDIIRDWLGWKNALDQIPLCGFAVGVVDGCLYVLGGASRALSVKGVWRYDPRLNIWQEVSSMATGRAFCKTSILKGKLYVVGGVSAVRGSLNPLQSAESFNPSTGQWTHAASMPFAKAQDLLTAWLDGPLKPIATGVTTYKGKLYVPQGLYPWPFFFDIGGEVYDPETDSWEEMPDGMRGGWPARPEGEKLSSVVDEKLYALEPSSSPDSCRIMVYDDDEDAWKVVISRVPLRYPTDRESSYLLAGLHGKLHVITKDVDNEIAVLQFDVEKCRSSASSPSTSSIIPASSEGVKAVCLVEDEVNVSELLAAKDFGTAELVSCQVLEL